MLGAVGGETKRERQNEKATRLRVPPATDQRAGAARAETSTGTAENLGRYRQAAVGCFNAAPTSQRLAISVDALLPRRCSLRRLCKSRSSTHAPSHPQSGRQSQPTGPDRGYWGWLWCCRTRL